MTTDTVALSEVIEMSCTVQSDCTCLGENDEPTGDCFGCYDESLEFLKEITDEWQKRLGVSVTNIGVSGSRMGWTGSSGSGHTTLDKIIDTVTLRGDFRVLFTLRGSSLTAQRWSHDEPTGGATFTFLPATLCDDCESEVTIVLVPYGTGQMAEITCPECGVSYDHDID